LRITSRCYAVTGLAFALPWAVNAGFVVGAGTTLVIDTGPNTLAAQTIHGYAVAAGAGNRLIAVNTEPHFDHLGGNSFFRERGIDIYGHCRIHRTAAELAATIAECNQSIPDRRRRERNEAAVLFQKTTAANPNRPVPEETVLELGGLTARLLFTPGHTPANLAVYIPEEGVLYAGDAVVSGLSPNLECGSAADWRRWKQSLARIAALQPEWIVPGHGPVISRQEREPALDRIAAALDEALAERET
jgi:glyoxylase-like metal-dependent hydrolase (beta-lactamase superfamily II)